MLILKSRPYSSSCVAGLSLVATCQNFDNNYGLSYWKKKKNEGKNKIKYFFSSVVTFAEKIHNPTDIWVWLHQNPCDLGQWLGQLPAFRCRVKFLTLYSGSVGYFFGWLVWWIFFIFFLFFSPWVLCRHQSQKGQHTKEEWLKT